MCHVNTFITSLWPKYGTRVPNCFLAMPMPLAVEGEQTNAAFAGLNTGLNTGVLRHDGSFNWQEQVRGEY